MGSNSNKSAMSILVRIQDFVPGWAVGDINDELGIVCNAFNHVIDLCPIELLVRHSAAWSEFSDSDTGEDVDGKKVLEVFSVMSGLNNMRRQCREVKLGEFEQTQYSGSTFYATKLTPVFCIDSQVATNLLKVMPADIPVRYTYITYFDPSAVTSALTATIFAENNHLPGTIEVAMILQACINLMRTKIAVASVDDEDDELIAIYNANIASCEGQLAKEMQRITGKKAE
jgi:hypothetical protein